MRAGGLNFLGKRVFVNTITETTMSVYLLLSCALPRKLQSRV